MGQLAVRHLPPATGLFARGDFALDQPGEDRRPYPLGARDGVPLPLTADPFRFDWLQEMLDQSRLPLVKGAGLRTAQVLKLFEPQKSFRQLGNPCEQR